MTDKQEKHDSIAPTKKPYHAPELRDFGDVHEVTQTGAGAPAVPDGAIYTS